MEFHITSDNSFRFDSGGVNPHYIGTWRKLDYFIVNNEGKAPPNKALCRIRPGGITYRLTATTRLKHKETIKLNYVELFDNFVRMKGIYSIILLVFLCSVSNAQKVFSVDYESRADVKVFVVKYESQADLLIYKVKYDSQAGNNDGKWFFTNYESQAKKKIFFVNYESQADLKIFFVEYESRAGWKNKSKMQLMY